MSYEGLFRSTNSGTNWNRILSGRCDDVIFSPTGDTVYVIGNGTGYKISVNGGVSFTDNATLIPGERNHIALCKSSPTIMYASNYNGGNISVLNQQMLERTLLRSRPDMTFTAGRHGMIFTCT
ncbi:MAG: hypothetical protein IPI04_04440 [Ignavibacteria bacterium]|nr:hypothetical protein [Ignavibacteria bacterium]